MIPSTVSRLKTIVLPTGTWYRAVPSSHSRTPLGSSRSISRFCSTSSDYDAIYLAADRITALLEVQALVRSLHARLPISVIPNAYIVFPISVGGIQVIDFGDPADRAVVGTSTQELTGDWRAYPARELDGETPIVRSQVFSAPTQDLGAALADAREVSGFLSPSAHNAKQSNLIVFPNKVRFNEEAREIVPL